MLIDVHAHDYPEAYLEAIREEGSGFDHYLRDDGRVVVLQDGAVALAMPRPMPTVAERIARMDAAGVGVQALSISAPNVYRLPARVRAELTRRLNDDLTETARSAPERFRVFASLPLPDVDAALEEVARAATLPFHSGFMVCTTIDQRTLDSPEFEPLWAELSRRRATVFVHPTTACCTDGIREYALALGIDFLAETTLCVARLTYSGLFERHPGIRWIFSHLGGSVPFLIHRFDNYYRQFPECREHISRPPSEILGGVWFDTVTTHPPALACALATFKVEQFVFGTDYPHVPGGLEVFAETLATAQLSERDRSLIEHETAAALLAPAEVPA
ncbi:MAG: amidohydrolase [Actinobacteria bacterium]|nr:amidohydrolase [Actinomycetota bacterium]